MMNATQSDRRRVWLFPLLLLLLPWLFLILWIPPFTLWAEFLHASDFRFLVLDYGAPVCYALLAGVMALHLANAVCLFRQRRLERMLTTTLMIRSLSIVTYPALLWGLLLSVLFLMGPERNEHIFLLMLLSFPVLNLSGACYAVPLIAQLKSAGKISALAAAVSILCQCVIGVDVIATFILYKKCRTLF